MAETVGSLIDKLSIMELRRWHTQEVLDNPEADPDVRAKCAARMAIIEAQSRDLGDELSEMWEAIVERGFRPKIYRQFKMYNEQALREASDPTSAATRESPSSRPAA